MAFVDAFAAGSLRVGTTYGFELHGKRLIAIKLKNSVFVLGGICTHERADLSGAPVEGSTLYCPRHFSAFDARSGDVLGPPAEKALPRYEAKIIGDRVWVNLGDELGETDPVSENADADNGKPGSHVVAAKADSGEPEMGGRAVEDSACCGNHLSRKADRTAAVKNMADDATVSRLASKVHTAARPYYSWLERRGLTDWLHGTRPFGHPLHPAVTDLPMGLWSGAVVLRLSGVKRGPALLTAAGVIAAGLAVASGATDWYVSEGRDRRIGLIHGAGNIVATVCEILSVAWHVKGFNRIAGGFGTVGLAVSLSSSYLGGHLVFDRGVMTNQTASITGPRQWVEVGYTADVPDGASKSFELAGRHIIVSRKDNEWFAIEALCTHAGGSLERGQVADFRVTCPLHGSVFSLEDGSVLHGPATRPQPCLDIRTVKKMIEVRVRV